MSLTIRVIAVQGVAAAAEIIVFSVRGKHIVNVIVKSLKGKERSFFIPLCRMIEYHIQDYLDPRFYEDL